MLKNILTVLHLDFLLKFDFIFTFHVLLMNY